MPDSALPPSAAALFALLRGEPAPDLSASEWDTVGVVALALGLAPLLASFRTEALPAPVAARMRLAGRRTTERNRGLLDALARILRACQGHSLPVIVLKGAYLAPAVYGDLGLRGMSDIDILVQPHDFARLQALLRNLGYEGKYTDPHSGPGIVKHEWTYKRADDELSAANPYLASNAGHHVEPHTSLAESWFGLTLDVTPGIWARAQAWELTDSQGYAVPASALNPVDAVLHQAVHLVFHLLMGKPAFVQLYDLRRLFEFQPALDLEDLLRRARASQAIAHLWAALRLAIAAYAAPIPSALLDRLAAECPPGQRARVVALDLPAMWALTQQPPLQSLGQRLRRGLDDRRLAAAWASSPAEARRVWRSAVLFYRTDTAALLRARIGLQSLPERS